MERNALKFDTRNIGICGACLLVFCAMSFFCAMTPWTYDDFGYGSGESSLAAIFAAQVQEHLTWSGKFVGHFMARVLLHGPAWLHPLLTPLVFLGLIFSGIFLVLGTRWRESLRAWHIMVLSGLVWFALPAFGTVYFWRTGTPDYGYSLAFATAFLVPYRFWAEKKDYHLPGGPLFAVAGAIAGCSNENVGMLAILVALGTSLYRLITLRRAPVWAVAGIVGAVVGWLFMMTAPGSTMRLAKIGGLEKIPVFSWEALHKFLIFWSSQQLELLPYALGSLFCFWLLCRQGRLKPETWLPGLVLFGMAQASLAAFVLSPSTPERAMSATFFYAALSFFSFLAALQPARFGAKLCYMLFCAVLLYSVTTEARIFLRAQPVIAANMQARAQGEQSIRFLAYPQTDKYFFPCHDIFEIKAHTPHEHYHRIPWENALPVSIAHVPPFRALVMCNTLFLENLPQGKVHVAVAARRQTLAGAGQAALRLLSPLSAQGTAPASAVTARYAQASARVAADGRTALHIPGLTDLGDVAYMGIADGGPVVWQRFVMQTAR